MFARHRDETGIGRFSNVNISARNDSRDARGASLSYLLMDDPILIVYLSRGDMHTITTSSGTIHTM